MSKKEQYLYLIQNLDNNCLKIGISVNPFKRIKTLQTGSPHKLKLIGVFKGGHLLEKRLHKMFWESRVRHNSEWFKFEPLEEYLDFLKNTLLADYELTEEELKCFIQ